MRVFLTGDVLFLSKPDATSLIFGCDASAWYILIKEILFDWLPNDIIRFLIAQCFSIRIDLMKHRVKNRIKKPKKNNCSKKSMEEN